MIIIYLLVIGSMFFVYFDTTKNKIGKIPGEKGLLNMSPGMWTVGTWLLWIVFFPLYLINRSKLIEKAKEHPQETSEKKRKIILGIIAVIFVLVLINGIGGGTGSDILADVSGVWRGDSDGAMVTIDLLSDQKTVDINGNTIPVSIKDIDHDNHIISLNIEYGDQTVVWAIRQVWDDQGESFDLDMSLHEGTTDSLAFVRPL